MGKHYNEAIMSILKYCLIKDEITQDEIKKIGFDIINNLSFSYDIKSIIFESNNEKNVLLDGEKTQNEILINLPMFGLSYTNVRIYFDDNRRLSQDEIQSLENIVELMGYVFKKFKYIFYLEKTQLYDTLTGFYNQFGLFKIMDEKKQIDSNFKLEDYSIVFVNFIDFKNINSIYGKMVGDIVFKKYALYFKSLLREDEIAARLDGDNFIVVLKSKNVDKFIDKVKSVEIPIDEENMEILTSRFGVYDMNPNDTFGNALDYVRVAMNIAKKNREIVVCFTDKIKRDIINEKEIMHNINLAMIRGEIVPFYQPKVNSRTGELIGCEALTRWIKNGNIISPGEFIPIVEKNDKICDLDMYLLKMVCIDLSKIKRNGILPKKVSVNFSKKNLKNPCFAEDVLRILDYYGIDYDLIDIELTESTKEDDHIAMRNFVSKMRMNGISISIDDFGTGYSSFNLIKSLDVNTIKIDKSFVDSIHKKRDAIVVKNLINMIQELGISTIAEGVETIEQVEKLAELGCEDIQGYYYDRPLPKDEYVKRLVKKTYK